MSSKKYYVDPEDIKEDYDEMFDRGISGKLTKEEKQPLFKTSSDPKKTARTLASFLINGDKKTTKKKG